MPEFELYGVKWLTRKCTYRHRRWQNLHFVKPLRVDLTGHKDNDRRNGCELASPGPKSQGSSETTTPERFAVVGSNGHKLKQSARLLTARCFSVIMHYSACFLEATEAGSSFVR